MEAQVLSLLEYYKNSNVLTEITLLQGFKNKSEKAALKKKLKNFNSKVIWFKGWPGYTFFQKLSLYSIGKVLDQMDLDPETIIHVRGEIYGAILQAYTNSRNSGARLLVDLRGIGFEEVSNYYPLNFILKRNKAILFRNSFVKIRNTQITAVSQAFKDYLVESHEFKKKNICVHPNIADKQFTFSNVLRKQLRNELGLGDDKLVAVCSSGGGAAWQKDQELIEPLMKLEVQIINLSTNRVEIPGVINKLVPFALVPAYLAAADMAILWRDEHIIHKVASPSKFSEFACMGLWVIHNGTVKIASDYIKNNHAGLIIKSPNQITRDKVNLFSNYNREDYSVIGRNTFGVEQIAQSYIKTYRNIIEGSYHEN